MQAMYKALTMPRSEREERAASLTQTVEREDVTHWLTTQIHDLMNLGPQVLK